MKSVRPLTDTDTFQPPVREPLPRPKVEKGVMIPASRALKDRVPLMDLEPGDSFLIPENVTRGALHHLAKRLGIVIEIHVTDKGERCWRIK